MSNLSELLPNGAGQNQVDFVASGSLAAGIAVAINTNGTVSIVSSSNIGSLIGITAKAISDTATGSINLFGGINKAQTGLTIGSDYYAQTNGTITTTSSSPAVKVGTAISATTINMRDLP